ncbi:MAG: signal peptidase I [Eubacterium sp.]|nr:signal peptidase I [Eubacterium sp.]
MSYEEEKEYKKQKKREEKELKKQQKLEKKKAKKASDDETPSEEIADAETVEAEAKETVETAEAAETVSEANTEEVTETVAETSEEAEAEEEDDEEYNPDYKKKKKKSGKSDEVNIVKELLNLIIYIGIVVIICFCIITFVGQRTTVHGHSMSPTLESGDNLWIDKFSYKIGDPKRFDIIVFPYKDTDVFYIKRVIGLPGETVQIAPDGSIIIDGQILQESYGKEIIMDSGTACDPITLGKDEYFVLGDNRNDSRDSRWPDVGNIHKSKIVGKAVFRLSPFSKFGRVK